MLIRLLSVLIPIIGIGSVSAPAQSPRPAGSTRPTQSRIEPTLCTLPQQKQLTPRLTCILHSPGGEWLQNDVVSSAGEHHSRAPYIIAGAVIGAVAGGLAYAHKTSGCNDWCLPGGFVVIPAAVGAVGGMAVGWAVSEIIHPE